MKNRSARFLFLIVAGCLQVGGLSAQTPPYSGTIFIERGILTENDCSTLTNVSYVGRGNKWVFDRRVNNWVLVNAYLFDVIWSDSLGSQAVVNPEFTLAEATTEANRYAFKIGQIPHCLREDVDEIWIHKGNFDWGGGNNSILIHTDRAAYYDFLGISEETLVHEASHTSLDANHSTSTGWLNAQQVDATFISTYAQQNPLREDIAESFLTWLAVRHFPSRVSGTNFTSIIQTIPNRLAYFDAQNFNLSPIPCAATSVATHGKVELLLAYPNPTANLVHIDSPFDGLQAVEIYGPTGQLFDRFEWNGHSVDLSPYPNGVYLVLVRSQHKLGSVRIMKYAN